MAAGQRADEHQIESVACDSAVQQQVPFEAEALGLRAEIAVLRERLALRDCALDATPTFFMIAELLGQELRILYCNNAVADQHPYLRQELLGKHISHVAYPMNIYRRFTIHFLLRYRSRRCQRSVEWTTIYIE